MQPLFAIIKKEWKGYIDHPVAYILAIVFLGINNFLFFSSSFTEGVSSLQTMVGFLPWLLLFFVPALTMRSWAEERREHTLSLLLSYPVKLWQLVVGKFLATTFFLSAVWLVTLTIPISLHSVGSFDWGAIFAQYLGAICLIAAMVAVGQWASTLSKNQVISFVAGIGTLFAFFLVSLDFVLLAIPYPLNLIGQQLGLLSHYNSLTRGVIDLRDLLYFASLAFLFLALSFAWLYRSKIVPGMAVWKKLQGTVALLIAIAVVINLFGQTWTIRFDVTKQQLYSLSPATKSILRNLDDSIRLTLYRSKKLPTQVELVSRDLQDVLRDYQRYGGSHVTLAVKYPDQDSAAQQEAQTKGITAVRFNVVQQDEFTLQDGYLGVTIEYLDKREVIPFVQNIGDIEYKLSRAIVTLRNAKKPKVGFVGDFGGKSLEDLSSFSQALRENYLVEDVKLSAADVKATAPQIDDSIDVLIIAAPTQAYSAAAITEVQNYIKRGGKILWLLPGTAVNQGTLSATPVTTGLESILAGQGITVQKDIVADLASHETLRFNAGGFTYFSPYPYWLRAATSPHVLVGNVQQVMFAWPSSISVDDKAKDKISPLVQTTNQAIHLTKDFRLGPDQLKDLGSNPMGTYVLAVADEAVPADSGKPAGRWVVIGTASLIENSVLGQYPEDGSLALNAVDWLSQNDALVAIRSKQSQPPALVWASKSQQAAIKWGNVIGAPALVAGLGFIWLYRRRRYIRAGAHA